MTVSPRTARTIVVPDELGMHGLRYAADTLEHEADCLSHEPAIAMSCQEIADWLRQVAVQVPDAA